MGFLSFLNPSAWLAQIGLLAATFLIGITAGGVLQYRLDHAAYWRSQAIAYQAAVKKSEDAAQADAAQATIDRMRAERAEAKFQELINASPTAGCKPTDIELLSLRNIIDAGSGSNKRSMPASSK